MRIDAHHHFWRYRPQEYAWIDDSLAVLRRDFLPDDLAAEIRAAGIDRVISVQARQSVEETEWLLDFADDNEFVAGVVGWAPLIDPEIEEIVEWIAEDRKLRGLRHVLQDEPDEYMLRDDFSRGLRAVERHGLVYDVLIYERQLPAAIELVDRHPGLRFVVDHLAKPRIRDGVVSPWRENLRELARRPNVWCKLSGVVTEADHRSWLERDLRPYINVALEAFGTRRTMFGSDWPVCLAAAGYGEWVRVVERAIGGFSDMERHLVMGGAAAEFYGISS